MYLSELRPLYDHPGPWVSIYLDASRADERGAEAVGLRWRAAREALAGAGAPEEVLSEVEGTLGDGALIDGVAGPHGLAVFAGPAGVALAEAIPQPPATTIAEVGPLPHVMPLLEQRGERVPWLRVVVDRTGADIDVEDMGHRHTTVTGSESYPISKRKPGGWSAPRYQSEVEVNWERNAGEVAATATRLAEQSQAELLVLAGDVRARQLVLEQLPKAWRERTVQADGSRAAGADPRRLDEQAQRAVEEVGRRRVERTLDRIRLHANHDLAATGMPGVVGALQAATAEAVVVTPSKLDGVTLWIGPEPAHLAMTEGELRRLGVAQPQRVRAADALARSTAATGAELFLSEGTSATADGVAVLLRGSP